MYILRIIIMLLPRRAIRNFLRNKGNEVIEREAAWERRKYGLKEEKKDLLDAEELELKSEKELKQLIWKIYISFSVVAIFFAILDSLDKDISIARSILEFEAIPTIVVLLSVLEIVFGLKKNLKEFCEKYIHEGRYNDCADFLGKCIEYYPKYYYPKSQYIYLMFITGKLSDCKNYIEEYSVGDRKKYKEFVNSIEYVVKYLEQDLGNKDFIANNKSEDMPLIVSLAELISDVNISKYEAALGKTAIFKENEIDIFKCIGYLVEAKCYFALNDTDKAKDAVESSLEFAPSDEVTQCIQRHLEIEVKSA